MWSLVGKVFSTISGIAGVVGWITLPDDAAEWPEKLRPLLVAVDRDGIVIILLAASSLGFAWTIFGPAIAGWYQRRRAAPLMIELPEHANDLFPAGFPVSPYRASVTIGVVGEEGKGVRVADAVSRHGFVFGVRNPPGSRPGTARNVRAELVRCGFGPIASDVHPVPLPPADLRPGPVDLPPGAERRFALIEFLSAGWGGMFSAIEFVEPERLAELRTVAVDGWVPSLSSDLAGAAVPQLGAGLPINLPAERAEVRLDVIVYADDLPPTRARFAMRRSDRVTVHLTDQGLSLPREKGSGSRWLAGIGRRTRPRTRPG